MVGVLVIEVATLYHIPIEDMKKAPGSQEMNLKFFAEIRALTIREADCLWHLVMVQDFYC